MLAEIAKGLAEGRAILNIGHGEVPKARRFLVEFEAFMTSVLAASQLASAQVHGLTKPIDISGLQHDEATVKVMSRAKAFVIEKVTEARQNVAGGKTFVGFPPDGFWIGTPAFESIK
jgi:hypothetical protein